MRIRVRAPATTANIGPGFDCAAAALELWTEVEVAEDGPPPNRDHLAVRAFERIAPLDGLGFSFTDRIPRERGLGSSAATIALGLVSGALVAGRDLDPEELLALGLDLEGHPDNLAAALAGGVCLTWGGAIARIADDAPGVPIAVVPAGRVATAAARAALPELVSHTDAAHTVGRAAVLGAALATGSATLFAAAAAGDRLHEPYRAGGAPLLGALRERPPAGAIAVTLSGSGPTVIVWAEPAQVASCADELRRLHPGNNVIPLAISQTGAGPA